MNFKSFLIENSVEDGFNDLKTKIHSMFDAFKRAAVNTWGKGNLNQKLKTDLMNDLYRMIQRLQVKNESVKLIQDLLSEAEGIASGLSPRHINQDTGKQVFNIDDVLKNMETKILQQVDALQRNVLMKKLNTIGNDVSSINKRLDAPARPLSSSQEGSLHTASSMLSKLMIYNKDLAIVHPFTGKIISPKDTNALKDLSYKDANFKLKYGNKEIPFNVGDIQAVDQAVNKFYNDNKIDPNQMANKWASKPFGAVHGGKLRPIKVS